MEWSGVEWSGVGWGGVGWGGVGWGGVGLGGVGWGGVGWGGVGWGGVGWRGVGVGYMGVDQWSKFGPQMTMGNSSHVGNIAFLGGSSFFRVNGLPKNGFGFPGGSLSNHPTHPYVKMGSCMPAWQLLRKKKTAWHPLGFLGRSGATAQSLSHLPLSGTWRRRRPPHRSGPRGRGAPWPWRLGVRGP